MVTVGEQLVPRRVRPRLGAWLGALALVLTVLGIAWWMTYGSSPAHAQVSNVVPLPSSPYLWADLFAGNSVAAVPVRSTADLTGAVEAIDRLAPRDNIHTNPIPRILRGGPATRQVVAITIDDLFGQAGSQKLGEVLDIAEAKGVRLTLFPTGGALEEALHNGQQEVWRRAVRDGDEIGNHTFTHANVTRLTDDQLRDELNRTQEMLNRVLGPGYDYKMRLMRPPGGAGGYEPAGNARIMANLTRLGYSMAMWSVDSNNTGGFDSYVDKIVSPAGARNGSIVLLHFTTFSPANFATLVDRLRSERLLTPVTVSELFANP